MAYRKPCDHYHLRPSGRCGHAGYYQYGKRKKEGQVLLRLQLRGLSHERQLPSREIGLMEARENRALPSEGLKRKGYVRMQTLSASSIRYLITMHSLSGENGMRCVDIAGALNVTKPSVHRMMETLSEKALVQKVKYGMVFFTEEGCKRAARYAVYYDIIFRFLCRKFALPPNDAKNAACALLAGISDERIGSMCEIMRDTS